jgi:DNA-binding MarR family transcriptional regulator
LKKEKGGWVGYSNRNFTIKYKWFLYQNLTMKSVPKLARKVLLILHKSENGIADICAADIGIDSKTFGVLLDDMWHDGLISTLTQEIRMNSFSGFALAANTDNTKINATITDKGEKYIKKLLSEEDNQSG